MLIFRHLNLKRWKGSLSFRYENCFRVLRIQISVLSLILKALDLPTIICSQNFFSNSSTCYQICWIKFSRKVRPIFSISVVANFLKTVFYQSFSLLVESLYPSYFRLGAEVNFIKVVTVFQNVFY